MLINEHDEKLSSSRKGFLGRLSKYIGRKKNEAKSCIRQHKFSVYFFLLAFRLTGEGFYCIYIFTRFFAYFSAD